MELKRLVAQTQEREIEARQKELAMQMKREKEREQIQQQREREKEHMKQQFELDTLKLQQQLDDNQRDSTSRSNQAFYVAKHIRLVPPFQEKDVYQYFLHLRKLPVI